MSLSVRNRCGKWAHAWHDYRVGLYRKISIGCAAGSVVGIVLHLALRDSHVAPTLGRTWSGFWSTSLFDAPSKYIFDLVVLFAAAALLFVPTLAKWLWKLSRSWWSGLVSLVSISAAISVASISLFPNYHTLALWSALPVVVIASELWRRSEMFPVIVSAARPVIREVNPFDLVLIAAIRRFAPSLFLTIRDLGERLTCRESASGPLSSAIDTADLAFQKLHSEIEDSPINGEFQWVLGSLFPKFAAFRRKKENATVYYIRKHEHSSTGNGRSICDPRYFPIYIFATVPEAMFSNSRFLQVGSDLNLAKCDQDIARILKVTIEGMNPGKTIDFLHKLRDQVRHLDPQVLEWLVYAVAEQSKRFFNGATHGSMDERFEALQAEEFVIEVVDMLGDSVGKRVVEKAILCACHDRLALNLFERTRQKRGATLSGAITTDRALFTSAFVGRMRARYNIDSPERVHDLSGSDWSAFARWLEECEDDRAISAAFWTAFIGSSPKKLTEAISFLYPIGFWASDPRTLVGKMFPMAEFERLLGELTNEESFDHKEQDAIKRMKELVAGNYQTGPGEWVT